MYFSGSGDMFMNLSVFSEQDFRLCLARAENFRRLLRWFILRFCAPALKFFAVGCGLLGVSVSILTWGRRTPTPRNSLPTFAEKLLMRLRTKTLKFVMEIS
jgi:hypothetical protein